MKDILLAGSSFAAFEVNLYAESAPFKCTYLVFCELLVLGIIYNFKFTFYLHLNSRVHTYTYI